MRSRFHSLKLKLVMAFVGTSAVALAISADFVGAAHAQTRQSFVAENLVVLLRQASIAQSGGGFILTRPFAGDVVQVIAIDEGSNWAYPTIDLRAELNLSEDEIWARARSNTLAKSQPYASRPFSSEGATIVTGPNGLGAAVMLEDDACRAGSQGRFGTSFVWLGLKDAVVHGPLDNVNVARALVATAHQYVAPDQIISSVLLKCEQGVWTTRPMNPNPTIALQSAS